MRKDAPAGAAGSRQHLVGLGRPRGLHPIGGQLFWVHLEELRKTRADVRGLVIGLPFQVPQKYEGDHPKNSTNAMRERRIGSLP